MKRTFFITLAMLTLMACSGEDPVYWYDAGSSDGAAGSNVPYYPDKPSEDDDSQQTPVDDGYTPDGYTLTWSDEFNSQANLYSQWNFNVGGTGWGNNELQYYCENGIYTPTGQQTASVSDGTLKIKAYKITPSRQSDNCEYISARMDTKEGWEHGYIEMRAKLPTTKGCWPAFWMLPSDGPYWVQDPTGWGGEIDIMEYVPNDGPRRIYFSAHCHDATRAAGVDTGYIDPTTGKKYSYSQHKDIDNPGDWHCYGMEWTSDYIRGYIDGVEYFYAPNPNPGKVYQYSWPFDQKFYIKLNLAIGGDWGGEVAAGFTEATYEIDWVRVYQK
jgi:beta-glucanase (GH16 family)